MLRGLEHPDHSAFGDRRLAKPLFVPSENIPDRIGGFGVYNKPGFVLCFLGSDSRSEEHTSELQAAIVVVEVKAQTDKRSSAGAKVYAAVIKTVADAVT